MPRLTFDQYFERRFLLSESDLQKHWVDSPMSPQVSPSKDAYNRAMQSVKSLLDVLTQEMPNDNDILVDILPRLKAGDSRINNKRLASQVLLCLL
jgi:hypothetical protein